jgi:hypothetical protein
VRVVRHRLTTVWGTGEKPFCSYQAESVLHGALSEKADFDEAMILFFDAAYEGRAPGVLRRIRAHLPPTSTSDPRPTSGVRHAKRRRGPRGGARGVRKGDLDEALDGRVEVFGSAFPAPSTVPERVAASLGAGSAGMVGAAIRAGRARPVIQSRPWRER